MPCCSRTCSQPIRIFKFENNAYFFIVHKFIFPSKQNFIHAIGICNLFFSASQILHLGVFKRVNANGNVKLNENECFCIDKSKIFEIPEKNNWLKQKSKRVAIHTYICVVHCPLLSFILKFSTVCAVLIGCICKNEGDCCHNLKRCVRTNRFKVWNIRTDSNRTRICFFNYIKLCMQFRMDFVFMPTARR